MAEIVAFEGKRNSRLFVAWGTAAIRDGEALINTTRQISAEFDPAEFQMLVSEGVLTELAAPIGISEEDAANPLVVLEIDVAEGFETELYLDRNRITTVLASSISGTRHCYVFASHEVFRQVANTLISQFLHCLLYVEKWKEGHDQLLRSAIALDAHHPVVNALRATRSKSPDAFLPIAKNNLRTEEARSVFESAWAAFTHDDLRYVLKYKGGLVRDEGGIQIGDVAKLMRLLQSAHGVLASSIARLHPFLDRPPETQLYELKAASAEFHFTVPPVSLGERLARYMELQMFEQALDGHVPSDGPAHPALVEAVRQIAAPTEETTVLQRLGAAALRPVRSAIEVTDASEEWSEPLTVLGYQSGLVRDTEQIEVNLFPGHRILVSSTDNGSGDRPIGLDFLQTSRDFLFRPALYKIQRWRSESRERFFLQEVVVMQPGAKGTATAIHSSIVPGAFVCNLSLRVARKTTTVLTFGNASLSGVDAQAVGDARKWMLAFAEICRELELTDTRHARLVPHGFKMPNLYEVLWAVAELGGKAHQTEVVQTINARFSKSALVNNTRREVLRNKALLQFAKTDSQVFVLTQEGRRYLGACNRITRRTQ
ncbi:MAG TPA: hypothetical protein VER96_26745 [Polyangiaceae bacterium]|nr:hypothetical protein [Polyangiaceae bacterium]